MHLFIGSTNPVKINSATVAASETWPEVTVVGYDVASGIPEQPWGDAETRQGAQNRAQAAWEAGIAEHPDLDQSQALAIGLEGGVIDHQGEIWSTVWIAVLDKTGNFWESNGARFKVPDPVAKVLREGGEMGPIIADIVQEADIRQKQGMIGIITNTFIDRTEEYTGVVKMALGLWYGRDWYNSFS